MAIVKQYDKRSGKTYVYESTSYWDKEKQQPRSKSRKAIFWIEMAPINRYVGFLRCPEEMGLLSGVVDR